MHIHYYMHSLVMNTSSQDLVMNTFSQDLIKTQVGTFLQCTVNKSLQNLHSTWFLDGRTSMLVFIGQMLPVVIAY